jgi:hypothetical protein
VKLPDYELTPHTPGMPTTPGQKLGTVITVMLALMLVAFAAAVDAEHRARLVAEKTVKQDELAIASAKKQILELQAEDKKRDDAAAEEVQKIRQAAASAQTPAQIVKYIHDQVKGAPAPIDGTIAAPTAADPNPPALFTVPAVDLSFLRDKVATCSADQISVPQLTGDLASCRAQAKLAGDELSKMQNERDAWRTAAKGGTWAQRIKSGAIKFGFGVAAGVAIDEAARRK